MDNYNLPARTGLLWLKDGFAIMKKAPLATSGIISFYLLMLLVAGIPSAILNIPFLDTLFSALVTPFAAMAIVSCGRDVDLTNKIPPLFTAYAEGWKNKAVRYKLLLLGVVYFVCLLVITYIFTLLAADSMSKWFDAQGQLIPAEVAANLPWGAFIVGFILYTILLCITCFAPMLIAWKKMPLGKSLFFSLFVCVKNIGAFIVLGCILFAISAVGTVALTTVGSFAGAGSVLVILWGLFMTCLSYCTLWPIWKSVFGINDCHV